jgi:DTW domain-containing protein YfiP
VWGAVWANTGQTQEMSQEMNNPAARAVLLFRFM